MTDEAIRKKRKYPRISLPKGMRCVAWWRSATVFARKDARQGRTVHLPSPIHLQWARS